MMRSTKGKLRRASRKSASAPSRSCTLADWTLTASSTPSVSVRMWALAADHLLAGIVAGRIKRSRTRVQRLLDDMLDQWRALDARIKAMDNEFAEMARNDPAARRLATIPGIGVLNATALVAAIG